MSFYQEEEEYDLRGSRRRTWDDEFVLKRQFSALIPAFDPRPGRTNVNQTQDFEITPPGSAYTCNCFGHISAISLNLLVFLAAFDFLLDDLYFGYTPVLKIQYYIVGSAESSQVEERDSTPQPRLQLYLKGPGLPGVRLYINLHYAHKYLSGTKY